MNEDTLKEITSLISLKNDQSSEFNQLLTNFLDQYYDNQTNFVQKINAITLQKITGKEVENSKHVSYVRFLNVASATSTFHIYFDGLQITHLSYKTVSNYLELSSGKHQIDIYDLNDFSQPLRTETIFLDQSLYYTIAITCQFNQLTLLQVKDDPVLPINETKIRFIHLANKTQQLDLAVKQGEGDVVFSNVSFKHSSEYLSLTPMSVNLELRLSGTKSIVYPLYKSKFQKNKIYDIVSIGMMNENPTFEVMILK